MLPKFTVEERLNKLAFQYGMLAALLVLGVLLITFTLPPELPPSELAALQATLSAPQQPVLFTLVGCPASDDAERLMAPRLPHVTISCPHDERCRWMNVMGKVLWGHGLLLSTPFPTLVLPNGRIVRNAENIALYLREAGYLPKNTVILNASGRRL